MFQAQELMKVQHEVLQREGAEMRLLHEALKVEREEKAHGRRIHIDVRMPSFARVLFHRATA